MRRWPEKYSSEHLHLPVMVSQVLEYIKGCPPGVFVDATLGSGGHLRAIQGAFKDVFTYIGFDLDSRALDLAKNEFAGQGIEAELVNENFAAMATYLRGKNIKAPSGVIYDLGVSSMQLDNQEAGFSYLKDGPLDLSFTGGTMAAARLINEIEEKELARLIMFYGQERRAKALARAITRNPDRIETTGQLAGIIRSVVGDRYFVKTASRVFQAIRIAVNDELAGLEKSLNEILPILKPGGRAIVISYHSLEDRIVKNIFRKYSGKCICPPKTPQCVCGRQEILRILTPKPLKPSAEEIKSNSRARSAKIRVAERSAV